MGFLIPDGKYVTQHPDFRYFISTGEGDAEADREWFSRPLPVSRRGEEEGGGPSYADFFGLLREILAGPALPALTAALGGAAPESVRIIAEKHGALYHPARVEVEGGGNRAVLCANAAISPMARFMVNREAGVLEKLAASRAKNYLPKCHGVFESETGALCGSILLTEWLTGFFEFHLAQNPAMGEPGLRIWDTERGPYFADFAFWEDVYFQAARILAYYYEPVSGEQVSPWHHAAGDFVVKADQGGRPEVRIITARGHDPLFGGEDDELPEPLDSGLYFFVNTTLRMRLDRENGTGGLVFAPEESVERIVEGFFQGLADRAVETGAGPDFSISLLDYLIEATPEGLEDAARELLSACDPASPDVRFLLRKILDHAWDVFGELNVIRDNSPQLFA